jgi:hypothetical protein
MNAAERLWQALARRDCNGVRAVRILGCAVAFGDGALELLLQRVLVGDRHLFLRVDGA